MKCISWASTTQNQNREVFSFIPRTYHNLLLSVFFKASNKQ